MSVRKSGKIIAGTPRETGGVEIGDVGFAPLGIDESLNLRRYLNGQVISQSQFASFTNKVKAAVALYPSLATTETNWQAEKSLSKLGQCGKFVVDDTAGTIRLPCVVNAQGLTDLALIGGIKAESLPNIKGELASGNTGFNVINGAFYGTNNYGSIASVSGEYSDVIHLDASRSSSTYQDNAPVQQEAIQYPYYIQVATGVEETLPAIREYKTNVPYVLGDSKYSETNPYNASWLVSNGQYNAKSTYPDMWTQLQVELNSSLNKGDTVIIDGKTYVKRGLPVKLSTATYTDYDWVVNTADETFRLPLLDGSEDLPSDRYEDFTVKSSGETYTAPANGILSWYCNRTNTEGHVFVQNETAGLMPNRDYETHADLASFIPAKRGDSLYVEYSNVSFNRLRFIYAKGNGSLYFYVGDTVQDASLINAGAVLGQLATKTNSVEAAAASMPSNRYIDLTLGASGSTYTAPANGYIVLGRENGTTSARMIQLINKTNGITMLSMVSYSSNYAFVTIPAKKGDNVEIWYDCTGKIDIFRFVYAEGENNV